MIDNEDNSAERARRVVVVTGAAQGIGAAIARRFAADPGWQVHGLDVQARPGKPGSGEGNGAGSPGSYPLAYCDVGREDAVANAIHEVDAELGRIDALVNAAGVIVVKPSTELTLEEFRRLVAVNLGGVWLCCKYAIPVMRRRREGVIVNIASVSAHVGQADHALYAATKGGILAFTRALALEEAESGIRVVSVSPGSVDTEMLRGDVRAEAARTGRGYEELKSERESEQALRRWASPEEIAEPVFFLTSDGASFMTGVDVLVDGGWTAR